MNNELTSISVLDDIWKLYKKYQPRLATNVYEFGEDLKKIIDNPPRVDIGFEPYLEESCMYIKINNKEIEHQIGDPIYYIWFSSTTGEVTIKDTLYVDKVEIDEDGIRYFDSDGSEILPDVMKRCGEFWSMEEAEAWLKENYSGVVKYKPKDVVFAFVEGVIITLRVRWADFMRVQDGRIVYEFEVPGAPNGYYLVDDKTDALLSDDCEKVCPIVFKSYKDARIHLIQQSVR